MDNLNIDGVRFYPPKEERINVWSHGAGLALSLFGLILLMMKGVSSGNTLHLFSLVVYGFSLVLLYSASTIYHNSKIPRIRARLNVFDHAAIYVLIAGTYSPLTLIALQGSVGWWLFGIAWGIALVGVVLKLFFIGRYKILSTIMYVVMGWIIIVAIKPLIAGVPFPGLMWLLAGGLSYTIGAVLYSLKGMRYNHAVFHMFVLLGSICHFVTVYFYC